MSTYNNTCNGNTCNRRQGTNCTKATCKMNTDNTKATTTKARVSAGNTAIPDAPCTVERVMNYDGPVYLLHVAHCPLCGKKHTHGGGDDINHLLLGHREAHCFDDNTPNRHRGYNLIIAKEAK